MDILYERIKELRKSMKMTQEDLAALTGYDDRSSISKIEKGLVDLSIDKVKEFAKALGCSTDYLMGWDDTPDYKSRGLFTNLTDVLDADDSEIIEIHPSKIRDFFDLLHITPSVFSIEHNIPVEWIKAVLDGKEYVLKEEMVIFTKALNVPPDYFSDYTAADYEVVSNAFHERITSIMKDAVAQGFTPDSYDESNVLAAYRKASSMEKDMVKRILRIEDRPQIYKEIDNILDANN